MNPYPQVVHTFTILTFVLGALLIPGIVQADEIYNGCDYVGAGATQLSNSYWPPEARCGGNPFGFVSNLATDQTLYGIEFYYESARGSGAPDSWAYVYDYNDPPSTFDGSDPKLLGVFYAGLPLTNSTYFTTYFSEGVEFTAGQSPAVLFLNNPDGTYAESFQTSRDYYTVLQYKIYLFEPGEPVDPEEGCLAGEVGNCINTVDPANNQNIATSSLPYTFAVDGYITGEDYDTGARIMIKVDRNTDQQAQGALLAWDSAFGNKTYLPINGSGDFDVSTSSASLKTDFPVDRVGLYRVRWELQTPRFSIFGFSLSYTTLESYSSRFTIATSTGLDAIQIDQEEYLQGVIDQLEGNPLDQCNFNFFDSAFDFRLGSDLLGCIGGMLHWFFVLPPGVLESTVTQLKEGFLTRVPWGYFTRVVTAVQGGAAGSLPTIHADIPIGPSDDISIEFDIDDMIGGAAALNEQFVAPNGDTAREIVEPILQLIVGLLVLRFIWNDVIRSVR